MVDVVLVVDGVDNSKFCVVVRPSPMVTSSVAPWVI